LNAVNRGVTSIGIKGKVYSETEAGLL
jgi:hypothetical protein